MSEQKSIELTDELFYKYMPMVEEILLKNAPQPSFHEFSDKFERRMDKLIRQERHSKAYRVVTAICKRVAVIFLALLLTGLTVTMSVEAFREKFFSFIREEVKGGFWEYRFEMIDDDDSVYIRKPRYIPEGYTLVDCGYDLHFWFEEYEGVNGEMIMIYCWPISDGTVMAVDSEYDEEEIISMHGCAAAFVTRYGDNAYQSLHWFEKNMFYDVYTGIEVPKEEIIKIAENMEVIKYKQRSTRTFRF